MNRKNRNILLTGETGFVRYSPKIGKGVKVDF